MRILLIHNRLRWHPLTWLSLAIRMFTCSKWNHVAVELNGVVWESIGKGVIKTPLQEWLHKSDRVVLPLIPEAEYGGFAIEAVEGQPYGFTDLIQIALHIIRTRWFATGNNWNGKDGTRPGWFCSELVAVVLGIDRPHLLMPCDFPFLRGLKAGEEFETKRH